MGSRLIDASYEYNWNPFVGCVTGLLAAMQRTADSTAVSAVSGAACSSPGPGTGELAFAPDARAWTLPPDVEDLLAAFGLRARVWNRDLRRQRPPFLLTRRLKRELRGRRPVLALGGGVDAPGLLIGYDDDRRAYRRSGPMSDEVSPWLSYDALLRADHLQAPPRLLVIRVRPGRAEAGRQHDLALDHLRGATPDALVRWAEVLESNRTIDPQGHGRAAQALAAARAEGAQFWRGVAAQNERFTPVAQACAELALALSGFATVFPYPAGGNPAASGVRAAGAATLRRAAELERLLVAQAEAVAPPANAASTR